MGEYKHGHSPRAGASPEYRVWTSMIQRCINPKRKHYDRYGGRGIQVCERWIGEGGFERFFADVGPRPSLQHTLDRFPPTPTDTTSPGTSAGPRRLSRHATGLATGASPGAARR